MADTGIGIVREKVARAKALRANAGKIFRALSKQYVELLESGDKTAAARVKAEIEVAKKDRAAARKAWRGEERTYVRALEAHAGIPRA